MGSIVSSITGGAGGAGGTGYSIDKANVVNPVQQAQTDQAYLDQQDALKSQKDFLNALNTQNGIGNQTSVFNQMQGVANGTGPNPAQAQLAQATGANVANQAALMAGQRGSSANAGMMARQAAQQGANTQQAAAGQAATLQANQSMNALNQMGNISQNQVSNRANANAGLNSAALQGQQNLLNAVSGVNNANVANQGSINAANAALAGGRQGQQGNMLGGMMSGIGGMASMFGGKGGSSAGDAGAGLGMAADTGTMMEGGEAAGGMMDVAAIAAKGGKVTPKGMQLPRQMYATGGMSELDPTMGGPASVTPVVAATEGPQSSAAKYMSQGSVDVSGPQMTPINVQSGGSGGGGGGLGGIMGSMPGLSGGMPGMPGMGGGTGGGGSSAPAEKDAEGKSVPKAESRQDKGFQLGGAAKGAMSGASIGSAFGPWGTAIGAVGGGIIGGFTMAEGGQVPALVSPGEQYLRPQEAEAVARGKANPLSIGERIPGTPKVKGNSYTNDTVPKTLHSGGVVIPNDIMQSKNPDKKAAEFVRQVMAKKGGLPSRGSK